jgi:hypothetical protein
MLILASSKLFHFRDSSLATSISLKVSIIGFTCGVVAFSSSYSLYGIFVVLGVSSEYTMVEVIGVIIFGFV